MKKWKDLWTLTCCVFLFCAFSSRHLEAVWSLPETISSPSSANQQVGVDGDGNALAIWQEFDGSNTNIQFSVLFKGTIWSPSSTIGSFPGNDGNALPQIAVNPMGFAVAVWEEGDGNQFSVFAATGSFIEGWSAPVQISDSGLSQVPQQQVAIDSSGNAIAIWVGTGGIIQSSTLPFGGSWSAPVNVSSLTDVSESPQIVVDSFGNAIFCVR